MTLSYTCLSSTCSFVSFYIHLSTQCIIALPSSLPSGDMNLTFCTPASTFSIVSRSVLVLNTSFAALSCSVIRFVLPAGDVNLLFYTPVFHLFLCSPFCSCFKQVFRINTFISFIIQFVLPASCVNRRCYIYFPCFLFALSNSFIYSIFFSLPFNSYLYKFLSSVTLQLNVFFSAIFTFV